MPIRTATWRDLLPASLVMAAAFKDESLFGAVLHPNRHTYPNDMYLFFLRELRREFFNPTAVLLVSHPNSQCLTITAVAIWNRKGPRGEAVLIAAQSWVHWIAARLVKLWNAVEAAARPNRAADPAVADLLERAYPFIEHHFTVPERLESWFLELLGAGPEWQGKGYGRELVRWGVERARSEGICASVMSAQDKERFYQTCGFGDIVGWCGEGEGNPMAGIAGGAIMFTELEENMAACDDVDLQKGLC